MECEVAITKVVAKLVGESATREYKFTVGGCSNFLALPREEIDALGLRRACGTVKLMSAKGLVDVETYFADGELMGQMFSGILVPSDAPKFGYHLLQNLRFKVNQATREIEKISDKEISPPFLNLGGRVVWN